jgi:hypothetical protein
MTAIYQNEVHSRRTGRFELGSGGTITRTFLVTTDDANDGPFQVRQVLPVVLGHLHPDDASYSCRSITCEPTDSPSLNWFATCEYSRQSNNPDDEPDNPLNEPVQVNISGQKVTKALTKDVDGNSICTSSLQAFDPPPEITRTLPVVTFVRNEPFYDISVAMDYIDHVNSGSFMGGAAGFWKCNDISADKMFLDQQEYFQVRYVFEYNPDGWNLSLLNVSYHEIDAGTVVRIKDDEGRDVAVPWPLDLGTGAAQASPLTLGSFNYREFIVFPDANFNSLGLPT